MILRSPYLVGLGLLLFLLSACSSQGAWDLLAKAAEAPPPRRLSLSLANLAQSTALDNFPVLIRLTAANFFYSHCRADGLDLRFYAEDGVTPLPFEREEWKRNGSSYFWVKVPSLAPSSGDTKLWIYYGGDVNQDASNPPAVWSNGYLAVLHGAQRKDATTLITYYANSMGGTEASASGAPSPPSDIGNLAPIGDHGLHFGTTFKDGMEFSGASQFDNLANLSFELWIKDNSSASGGMIFYKGPSPTAPTPPGILSLSIEAGQTLRFVADYSISPLLADSPANMVSGTWTYIGLTWSDGGQPVLYRNSAPVAWSATSGPSGTRLSDAGKPLTLGNDDKPAVSPGNITADLDEVRISNVVRSADWIKASYLNESSDLLVFGQEEDQP